jgi:hypothetical protein
MVLRMFERRPIEISRHKRDNNIKMDLACGLNLSGRG